MSLLPSAGTAAVLGVQVTAAPALAYTGFEIRWAIFASMLTFVVGGVLVATGRLDPVDDRAGDAVSPEGIGRVDLR